MPKDKEPEPEVIMLKKVPLKPSEPEKQVATQRAEVTKHHDPELTVHGLHGREDREVITLGRTERVFTATEGMVQLDRFDEAVAVEQITEKEVWTRTPKPHKAEEPGGASTTDKKKITKLRKPDEQKKSVKRQPTQKSEKPEEVPQKIKLKKVPTKPKESEKQVLTHEGEVTKRYDTEVTIQDLCDREDRDIMTLGKTEQVFTADKESSVLGHLEKPEELEPEDEESRWPLKEKELGRDLTKTKIKKLQKKDKDQEIVTLKPFKRSQEAKKAQPPKALEEKEAKTDTTCEALQRDRPTAAIKQREEDEVFLKAPEVTPDVIKDQEDIPQNKEVEQVPKHEKPAPTGKLYGILKTISTPEKGDVVLKPFSKVTKPEEKPEKEAEKNKVVVTTEPSQSLRDKLVEQQPRAAEKTPIPQTDERKTHENKEPAVPSKKSSPPGNNVIQKREAEKKTPQNQAGAVKKGTEQTKVSKEVQEESFKPPNSKDTEQVPTDKKPSAQNIKMIPAAVEEETVGLKKPPKKTSPEEVSELDKSSKLRLPMVKEVSPGAVHMKKVPTQQEEEVFEEEAQLVESQEEEEAWGWELVPPEDLEGGGLDGALQTPGMPSGKRGEMKANGLFQEIPVEAPASSHLKRLI